MNIKVKKLHEDARLPTRGSEYSAGYDLYAIIEPNRLHTYNDGAEFVTIPPHTCTPIRTGLAMELPHGYFGAIFAISGLATKEGLRPATCTSVIDSDYKGEVIVPLHNDTDYYKEVRGGDRIAQLVLLPYQTAEFTLDDNLSETDRGTGGFGSTNK